MDDKWFKAQQKKAGVTADEIGRELGRDRSVVSRIYTGRQRMSADQAKVFAKVLNIPLSDVLKRAGILDDQDAVTISPGYAESDVTPLNQRWTSKAAEGEAFVRLLGAEREGTAMWMVKSRAMSLGGLLPGDQLIADKNSSSRARSGDTVIAEKYDHRAGSSVLLLRRFEPPVLVSASDNPEDQRVHVVDDNIVTIKSVVIGSWRVP